MKIFQQVQGWRYLILHLIVFLPTIFQDTLASRYIGISKTEKRINLTFYRKYFKFTVTIKGEIDGKVPYLRSLLINGVEQCNVYLQGFLNGIVADIRLARYVRSLLQDNDCGRRKLDFNELMINAENAAPGEWPWHAAIFRYKGSDASYICGGTLISKLFVLTAAHCVTMNNAPVVPNILSIILGKNNLIESSIFSQVREVFSVIVHEEFRSPNRMDNDIALLKLMSEAVYNDYIQPACLWKQTLSTDNIIGTVAGWGKSQIDDDELQPELKHASLPVISEVNCIKSNPSFYGPLLYNNKKFCAGWNNGTSPCNGDSGGGFMVYVPDDSTTTGAWHIKGILSYAKTFNKICEPDKYVLFTDVTKYDVWIRAKTYDSISCGGL